MLSSAWETFRESTSRPAHRPLEDDRSIRLIQLIPDTTQSHGFWVSLQHFPLGKLPSFDVLSYTRGPKYVQSVVDEWEREGTCDHFAAWARAAQPAEGPLLSRLSSVLLAVVPEEAPNNVKVNDAHFVAHEDVLDFLKFAHERQMYRPRELRQSDVDRKEEIKQDDIYLWVDNICINQKDAIERSRQTVLLSTLYKASQRTLVWLSRHEPPDSVHRVMSDFSLKCLRLSEEKGPDFIWKLDPLGRGEEMKAAFGEDEAKDWLSAMIHLWVLITRHQYFHQGWMQEVLLSPNAQLVCGSRVWDWVTFERFLQLIGPSMNAMVRHPVFATFNLKAICAQWRRVISSMQDFALVRQFWMSSSTEARREALVKAFGPLSAQEEVYCQILKMSRLFKGRTSEDKRDCVYGWLGLTTLVLPEGKIFGSPSYTLTTPTVYTRFAQSLMKGRPTLDILNDVEDVAFRKMGPDLPSWVPDYSVQTRPIPFHSQEPDAARKDFDATLRGIHGSLKSAEGSGTSLWVSAVPLDIISHRGPQLVPRSDIVGTMRTQWFLERCLDMKTYHPTGQSPQEALCYTLVGGGLTLEGPTSPREVFQSFWSYLLWNRKKHLSPEETKTLLGLVSQLASSNQGASWLPTSGEVFETEEAYLKGFSVSREDGLRVLKLTVKLWHGRAAFVSKKGYWGLCGGSVKAGDQAWLLEGGRTPYVLRKRDDGAYRFMGEAYVHGFMHGEGWTTEMRKTSRRVRIC